MLNYILAASLGWILFMILWIILIFALTKRDIPSGEIR